MRVLAPRVAELRDRFKGDPRKLSLELADLYRVHRINPLTGFLSAILQAPIVAGLWALFRRPNVFVPAIGTVRRILRKLPADDVSAIRGADKFLGVPLDATPNLTSLLLHPGWLMIPILVILATYWQQHTAAASPEQARLLIAIMALAIGYFAIQFPFGMSVYWIVSSVVSVAENYLVLSPRTEVFGKISFSKRRPAWAKKGRR
jgi:YidC/Oxa1 family membrane protein insertase